MMGPGRAKLGLKRKDRAGRMANAHIDLIDGSSEEYDLDLTQVPGAIVIPSFYEAGALSDKP